MDEEKWIRRSKRLDRLVMDADIEGVYELQTPLLLRAILTLGCVARVGFERARRVRDRSAFELKDLDFLTTASHSYLNPSSCTWCSSAFFHQIVNCITSIICITHLYQKKITRTRNAQMHTQMLRKTYVRTQVRYMSHIRRRDLHISPLLYP